MSNDHFLYDLCLSRCKTLNWPVYQGKGTARQTVGPGMWDIVF